MVFNVVAERVCVACLELLPKEFVAQLRRERWEMVDLEQFAIMSDHLAPCLKPHTVIAGLDPAIHISVENQ